MHFSGFSLVPLTNKWGFVIFVSFGLHKGRKRVKVLIVKGKKGKGKEGRGRKLSTKGKMS